jgi:hypothetical protein
LISAPLISEIYIGAIIESISMPIPITKRPKTNMAQYWELVSMIIPKMYRQPATTIDDFLDRLSAIHLFVLEQGFE